MDKTGPVDDKYLHNHSYGQVWSSLFFSQAWKVERKSHSLLAAAWSCVCYQLPGFQISSSGRQWQIFLFMPQSCSSKSNFYIRNYMISQHRALLGSWREFSFGVTSPWCTFICGESPQDSVGRADLHSVGGVSAFAAKVYIQTLLSSLLCCSCTDVKAERGAWSGRHKKWLGWRITAHHRPLWMWVALGLVGQVWTQMRCLQNAPWGKRNARPQMAREGECWHTGFVKLWQHFCFVLLLQSKFPWGGRKQALLNDIPAEISDIFKRSQLFPLQQISPDLRSVFSLYICVLQSWTTIFPFDFNPVEELETNSPKGSLCVYGIIFYWCPSVQKLS